jgi:hypothetical protein
MRVQLLVILPGTRQWGYTIAGQLTDRRATYKLRSQIVRRVEDRRRVAYAGLVACPVRLKPGLHSNKHTQTDCASYPDSCILLWIKYG